MTYDNQRREDKPCKRCGFVRTVKVRDRREFVPDGTMVPHAHYEVPQPGGEFKVTGESFEEHCRACKLEFQISVYERNIRKLAAQVREERIRQEKAKQKRTLSELKRKGVIP